MANINGKSEKTSWLILGILGILLIVGRHAFKNVLYIILGIGLIVAAAAGLWGWWQHRNTDRRNRINLLACAAMMVAGFWFVFHPGAVDSLLNILIGVALIVFGLVWISQGLKPRDNVTLCLGVGAVALGLFCCFTRAATTLAVFAAGASLIYAAVTGYLAEKRRG